jgi:hypothetical protein
MQRTGTAAAIGNERRFVSWGAGIVDLDNGLLEADEAICRAVSTNYDEKTALGI